MPHPAVLPLRDLRARRLSRRATVVGELSLGLLLGIAAGWLAGLLRVRRP